VSKEVRKLYACKKTFGKQVDNFLIEGWILAIIKSKMTPEEFRSMIGEFITNEDPEPPTPGLFIAAAKAMRESWVTQEVLKATEETAKAEQDQRRIEWQKRHFGEIEPSRVEIIDICKQWAAKATTALAMPKFDRALPGVNQETKKQIEEELRNKQK
jgi:hypothetical protein